MMAHLYLALVVVSAIAVMFFTGMSIFSFVENGHQHNRGSRVTRVLAFLAILLVWLFAVLARQA
jgi:NO-binding membrane sensor protein with MHYT domain